MLQTQKKHFCFFFLHTINTYLYQLPATIVYATKVWIHVLIHLHIFFGNKLLAKSVTTSRGHIPYLPIYYRLSAIYIGQTSKRINGHISEIQSGIIQKSMGKLWRCLVKGQIIYLISCILLVLCDI